MDKKQTGVGVYTLGMLNELFRQGGEHAFFLLSTGGKKNRERVREHWSVPHVHFVHVGIPNRFLNFFLQISKYPLDSLLRRRIPAGESLDVFFSPSILFGVVSKKVKHVVTIHDLSFELYPEFLSFKRRLWHRIIAPKKICQDASIVVTVSDNTKRDVVRCYGIAEEKVIRIYPGIKKIPGMADHAEERPYILYLGTIEPRKNVDGVVEAFLRSKLSERGFQLVIAGSYGWKSGHVMKKIRRHREITWKRYVSEKEKNKLIAGATTLVFPSFYEGFGFPPLEAMAVGTPVITSCRSSLPEVCGDAAWYVEPYSVSSIAYALRTMCLDRVLQDKYRKKGYTRSALFTWQAAAQNFLKSIREL